MKTHKNITSKLVRSLMAEAILASRVNARSSKIYTWERVRGVAAYKFGYFTAAINSFMESK